MLYAHLNKFVDLNKPLHPVVEQQILDYTEFVERSKFFSAFPTMNENEEYTYTQTEWIIALKDSILPWTASVKKQSDQESGQTLSLIERWKKANKE